MSKYQLNFLEMPSSKVRYYLDKESSVFKINFNLNEKHLYIPINDSNCSFSESTNNMKVPEDKIILIISTKNFTVGGSASIFAIGYNQKGEKCEHFQSKIGEFITFRFDKAVTYRLFFRLKGNGILNVQNLEWGGKCFFSTLKTKTALGIIRKHQPHILITSNFENLSVSKLKFYDLLTNKELIFTDSEEDVCSIFNDYKQDKAYFIYVKIIDTDIISGIRIVYDNENINFIKNYSLHNLYAYNEKIFFDVFTYANNRNKDSETVMFFAKNNLNNPITYGAEANSLVVYTYKKIELLNKYDFLDLKDTILRFKEVISKIDFSNEDNNVRNNHIYLYLSLNMALVHILIYEGEFHKIVEIGDKISAILEKLSPFEIRHGYNTSKIFLISAISSIIINDLEKSHKLANLTIKCYKDSVNAPLSNDKYIWFEELKYSHRAAFYAMKVLCFKSFTKIEQNNLLFDSIKDTVRVDNEKYLSTLKNHLIRKYYDL